MEGFYKSENIPTLTGTTLLHGPNFVLNKDYELFKEQKDSYTYPVDGWYWFDTEDEAYNFFGIEKPVPPE